MISAARRLQVCIVHAVSSGPSEDTQRIVRQLCSCDIRFEFCWVRNNSSLPPFAIRSYIYFLYAFEGQSGRSFVMAAHAPLPGRAQLGDPAT
jgi:hypothetical protein